mgnify:CR=1 FL=1
MSLKELTADKHKEAESTNFMRAVFARKLPDNLWADWTYQKALFYGAIEGAAGAVPAAVEVTETLSTEILGLEPEGDAPPAGPL